jgi:hypothetical protein
VTVCWSGGGGGLSTSFPFLTFFADLILGVGASVPRAAAAAAVLSSSEKAAAVGVDCSVLEGSTGGRSWSGCEKWVACEAISAAIPSAENCLLWA